MLNTEHFDYDIVMGYNTIELLKTEGDQLKRNILHAACSVYLHNVLTVLNTDVNNFKARVEAQVKTLTSARTAVMEEKLNTPDYESALAHIVKTLRERGIHTRLTPKEET